MSYIPRLEWGEISISGTLTIGNPTITGVVDTSKVVVGMIVTGTGIQTDSVVQSKTVNSITLTKNATANGLQTLAVFYRYDFQYPPVSDSEDNLKAVNTVTKSLSGIQQTQTNYIEANRALEFGFVLSSDRDILQDNFYRNYAALNAEFRYFEDKDLAGFEVYTLSKFDFDDNRQIKKHPLFLYKIKFGFRRAITL